jgi:hypothetical protein
MKYLLSFILVVGCFAVCSGQSQYKFVDSMRTFTTTPDTLKVTSVAYEAFNLIIYNAGSDTLLWRTDYTTKWNVLPPGWEYVNKEYLRYLYRKAKHSTTTSEATGS